MPNFEFLEQLCKSLHNNQEFRVFSRQIQDTPASHPDFGVWRGLIFHKQKIWLAYNHNFISLLLEEFHSTPLAVTWARPKLFAVYMTTCFGPPWSNMSASSSPNVSSANKPIWDQEANRLTLAPSYSYRNLERSFPRFHYRIAPSQGFTNLVVVDCFTKGSHFGALSSTYIAHKVALLFMDIVSKLYGFPISLVSNCNLIFISSFWRELFRICGTKLRMSTSYTQKPTARLRYSTESSNNISEHSFTIRNHSGAHFFPSRNSPTTLLSTSPPVYSHFKPPMARPLLLYLSIWKVLSRLRSWMN